MQGSKTEKRRNLYYEGQWQLSPNPRRFVFFRFNSQLEDTYGGTHRQPNTGGTKQPRDKATPQSLPPLKIALCYPIYADVRNHADAPQHKLSSFLVQQVGPPRSSSKPNLRVAGFRSRTKGLTFVTPRKTRRRKLHRMKTARVVRLAFVRLMVREGNAMK